jgi:signal transduction histidine kinase/CheY-like chemotaxis protein
MFNRVSEYRKRGRKEAIDDDDVLRNEERPPKRFRHTNTTETYFNADAGVDTNVIVAVPTKEETVDDTVADTAAYEPIVPVVNREMSLHLPPTTDTVVSDLSNPKTFAATPPTTSLEPNQQRSNTTPGGGKFVCDCSEEANTRVTDYSATMCGEDNNGITSTPNRWFTNHDAAKCLYGDTVYVLTGLAIIPTSAWKLYQMEPDDPKRVVAVYVYMTQVLGPFLCLLAVLLNNVWFSRLGMAGALTAATAMNLTEWPDSEECTITAMCQGGVLVSVIGNVSLSFLEKIVRLGVLFVVSSAVSIHSPHSDYMEDTFPIMGGTILVSIFVLYVYHFKVGRTLYTILGARLILAVIYLHHAAWTMKKSKLSGYESMSSLLQGATVTSIAFVAVGTYQNEVIRKEGLELLVQKRTQKLHMVNMALQASETAIAITDKMGCIIWLNAAFERLSGEKEEGLLGRILKDVIYKLDTTRMENKYILMESYDHPSEPIEGECQIGESIFRLEATPFPAESCNKNRPTTNDRFLMVFKNITATRAKEVAEKNAQDEATMAKAMGESMVTLTHELRTPLQGIMGVTSLLLQQASGLKDDALDSLKLIMASSILLLNLVNNLLDIKKADAKSKSAQHSSCLLFVYIGRPDTFSFHVSNTKVMEEFTLASLKASAPIKDAVSFCLPLASISNVNIVTDLRTAENAIVKSNPLRLQQVLINLVSNAIKYTKRGSDICVQIRSTTLGSAKSMINHAIASSKNGDDGGDGDEFAVLVFSVSDHGPGIVIDQADRLFRRYAQLDTEPTRTLGSNNIGQPSGTGLGLHLCQLFVERMNGRIWVTNNGKDVGGSCFSFYLPLVSCEAHDTIEDPGMLNTNSRVSFCHPNLIDKQGRFDETKDEGSVFDRRVLLVDDTLINRKVVGRMLKTIGISNPVTMESGKEALEELSTNRYDLVITDLQMPGMSGTELSAAIQDMHNESTLPIVVGFTADSSSDAAERCSKSGMSDLLYKPITLSEMKDYFETTVPNLKPGIWHKV